MNNFNARSINMGLLPIIENGIVTGYSYSDQYSEVQYKHLKTLSGDNIDNLAIFTRKDNNDTWKYVGIVSDDYKFIGNTVVLNQIRDSIASIQQQIFLEDTKMNSNYTYMQQELIIQNPSNIPEVGSIYPHITVTNSYNGFAAITVNFGISMINEARQITNSMSFRQKLAKMRQIHFSGSSTSLSLAIGDYVQSFNENIGELISLNMNRTLSEEDMLKSLDLVERIGKKKREEISIYLTEISVNQPVTIWKLFQAITKFSAIEGNLNAKKMLENVIERVLIVPQSMIMSLPIINS